MYNFCFRYHNLDYCYMAFDIKEDQVPAALDAMRLFNMRGCNVTMPCKTAAAQNMDELSPAARIIGAVNTIVNENGKLVGHMTDGIGFVSNLKDHGVDVKGKKMVVFRCRWSSNSDPGTVCTGAQHPFPSSIRMILSWIVQNTAEKLKKKYRIAMFRYSVSKIRTN